MKKNIKLLLLCSALLFTGCSRNVNSSNSSIHNSSISSESSVSSEIVSSNEDVVSSSNVISSEESISSENVSSENSTNVESSSEEIKLSSLSTIKEKARELSNKVNNLGVAESDIKVKIDLKLLAYFDMITTKTGMGDRYKLLMTDGSDYIYVKTSFEVYDKAKNRVGETLTIEGTVSLYCGIEEITHNNVFSLNENKVITDPSFNRISLEELYDFTDNMKLNNKGCNGGKIASIECKYLGRMDDSVGLFYDGVNIVNVHGNPKILNNLVSGNSYILNGAINVYSFRPGFQYYSHESSTKTFAPIDASSLEVIDESIYNIKYEVDKNPSYPNYSNTFKKLRRFEGYPNYYIKSGKYYCVLEKDFKEDVYSAYTNAAQAKTLFLKNENMVGISKDLGFSYNPLHTHYENGEKVSLVVAPYVWNTNKYWQVYALENTIKVIDLDA